MPAGHGLVEADFPRGKEFGIHVVIPCLYHLANLPKLINIGGGGGVSVSEPKFTSDGIKAAFRHEFPKAIGEWICLFIKGGDTPKKNSSIQTRWKLITIDLNIVVDLQMSTEQ